MSENQQDVSAEVESRANPEEMQGLDPDTLDPNKYYRWVHNRPQRIARMRSKGFTFSSPEEVATTTGQESHTADDKIINGDTVLMEQPLKKHKESRDKIKKTSRARLAAPKQTFKKKAVQGGVEINTSKKDKD